MCDSRQPSPRSRVTYDALERMTDLYMQEVGRNPGRLSERFASLGNVSDANIYYFGITDSLKKKVAYFLGEYFAYHLDAVYELERGKRDRLKKTSDAKIPASCLTFTDMIVLGKSHCFVTLSSDSLAPDSVINSLKSYIEHINHENPFDTEFSLLLSRGCLNKFHRTTCAETPMRPALIKIFEEHGEHARVEGMLHAAFFEVHANPAAIPAAEIALNMALKPYSPKAVVLDRTAHDMVFINLKGCCDTCQANKFRTLCMFEVAQHAEMYANWYAGKLDSHASSRELSPVDLNMATQSILRRSSSSTSTTSDEPSPRQSPVKAEVKIEVKVEVKVKVEAEAAPAPTPTPESVSDEPKAMTNWRSVVDSSWPKMGDGIQTSGFEARIKFGFQKPVAVGAKRKGPDDDRDAADEQAPPSQRARRR